MPLFAVLLNFFFALVLMVFFSLCCLFGGIFFQLSFLSKLLFLCGFLSYLHLSSFGLPFNNLISNDINSMLIFNTSSNVVFKLFGVALSVEICIKEHSEVPILLTDLLLFILLKGKFVLDGESTYEELHYEVWILTHLKENIKNWIKIATKVLFYVAKILNKLTVFMELT